MISIIGAPQVLYALSPTYALAFILENGWASLIVMSAVILCVTGGEALYADMGHLGREPIVKGWVVVFPALVLSYLGQGAYVIQTNNTHNVLFSMIHHISPIIYVPFLILSIGATVIASQAMISGMFSIVYQGMTTRILPKMKIEYTSPELQSQIYIDSHQLDAARGSAGRHVRIPLIGEPCISVWSRRFGFDVDLRYHDGDHLPAQAKTG